MIRFIATKHPDYAEGFPGDTVIDPWRYVKGARGIGSNKPTLISILVPSRGRPAQFIRMANSARRTATHDRSVEVVVYLDDDDPTAGSYYGQDITLRGPRVMLSEMWNECAKAARGDILMHCGDDIVFKTEGWDVVIRDTFNASADKILLVHGDDCSPNTDALATHGFIHRRWYETLGYFVPPLFSSDWNDVWLTEVADMIGRRVKVPIVTEHMHYTFGKAERDQTHADREERGARDGVVELFKKTKPERISDAEKLKAVMA